MKYNGTDMTLPGERRKALCPGSSAGKEGQV